MTNEEKVKVKTILQEYNNCYVRIETLEKEIEKLLDNKNQLVTELHSIRKTEMEVVSELQSKYGDDASIDFEKFEIVYDKT